MPDTFSVRYYAIARLGEPLPGTVESVFDSSANLRLEGALWNATIRRDALHPQGVLIQEKVLRAIEVDQPARLSQSLLEIGPMRLEAGSLIAEPTAPERIDAEMIAANLPRLDRHLRLFGRPSIVRETMIDGRDPETAKRIKELLARHHPSSGHSSFIIHHSSFPLGGGEGSTPAWDDFATGIILADRLFRPERGAAPTASLPPEIRERTTELSALQLEWALEGRSALVIEELIATLAARPLPASLIARCLSLGHSSGSDIVTGIHAALKSWSVGHDSS